MLSVFSKAYKRNNDKVYKKLVDDIFDFVENNLTANNDLIFSSISAVTEIGKDKIEGDYYVWNKDEIKSILEDDFELFSDYFNLNKFGFWEKNKYVLKRINDDDFYTKKYNLSSKTTGSPIPLIDKEENGIEDCHSISPVSYTHLTLPTILLV